MAYGIAVGISGLLVTWIIGVALFGGTDTPPAAIGLQLLSRLAQVLWLAVIPVCVACAVLRRRLWDIGLVTNRTLVYAALTALVGGLYALLMSGVGVLVPVRGHLLASFAATGLIAALFAPLRLRVQRAVNRLLFSECDESYTVLAHLSARLGASLAPAAVLPTIGVIPHRPEEQRRSRALSIGPPATPFANASSMGLSCQQGKECLDDARVLAAWCP